MPIEDPTLYSKRFIGPGRIATLEPYRVNVETAGADIKFGQAVVIKNGVVIPATKAPIYGIALNRDWTSSLDFIQKEMDQDHYSKGQALDVLRDGTISVTVSADVNRGENATVDADGNFKPAGASDKVVGVFLSAANKDEVARLQTRIQFDHGNADDDTANNPSPAPSTKQETPKPDTSNQSGNQGGSGSNK
ncbi:MULTISPECIES: DUF2190 family protein [Lactobacillus]|uniref:Uncharacterized protein n=1 Tax=Lactobacillus xujianguonis TaxID=2495899 RepID=A0A437SSY7_9LACO|nr:MULTISPECIES: DUF2190 family protein [Lactobacillus]RVU70018.1 hypothetical protein EJK17_09795 [Lactobacillus xujianguonis]RVU73451.1 hypothetical protein EJK20_08185 [Lactobacillus xujianguonis]